MAIATAPPISTSETASTRNAILDAAERHFAEAGFAGASMRDIAADVGLKNQASLYHYYRGKQELYDAVMERAVSALVPLWSARGQAIAAADSALERVTAVSLGLEGVLTFLEQHPHVARLIERAGLEEDRYVRDVVSRLLRPLFEAGVSVLRETGTRWPPEQLPHLAAGLYHLIFGYFANAGLLRAVMRDDPRDRRAIERQRRFLAQAISRLLDVPGTPNLR
jgi:AcrR family transcriptional regulator